MDVTMANKLTGAEELTGNDKASHILSELNRRNLFTEKRVEPHSVYQYHPLFREFLLSRLISSCSSEEISMIQRKAANILEEAGSIEEAVELFCKTAEWGAAAGIIMKHATAL